MRRLKHRCLWGSLFLLATTFLGGCDDDESYTYPSVQTEFVCGHVNKEVVLDYVLLDDGTQWVLENKVSAANYKVDSLYRFYCILEANKEQQTAKVYQLKLINVGKPTAPSSIKGGVMRDPLTIQSIWNSGNYLNIIARPMIQSITHSFSIIEDSVVKREAATHVYLSLHHNQNGDVEAYEEKTYLSIPLESYHLQTGDSITFSAMTYKEGYKSWYFEE